MIINRNDVSNIIPDNISELTITGYAQSYPYHIFYINGETCTIKYAIYDHNSPKTYTKILNITDSSILYNHNPTAMINGYIKLD